MGCCKTKTHNDDLEPMDIYKSIVKIQANVKGYLTRKKTKVQLKE